MKIGCWYTSHPYFQTDRTDPGWVRNRPLTRPPTRPVRSDPPSGPKPGLRWLEGDRLGPNMKRFQLVTWQSCLVEDQSSHFAVGFWV